MNAKLLKRRTAALIAALTAAVPLSGITPAVRIPAAVHAAETDTASELPDWLPTDYASALEFRNTYGKTHVEDGIICIVFEQRSTLGGENTLRYRLKVTENAAETIADTVYASAKSDAKLEVFACKPSAPGAIEAAIIDTYAKFDSLVSGYEHAVNKYLFTVDAEMHVTQADIFSWLPDSEFEFLRAFSDDKAHAMVYAHGEYVVFLLKGTDRTHYDWLLHAGNDSFASSASCECTPVTELPLDGGEYYSVRTFRAVRDGAAKLTFEYNENGAVTEPIETITADCVMLDDGKTVLLPDMMCVRLIDRDTGELIPADGSCGMLWTDYALRMPDGKITGPRYGIPSNPAVFDKTGAPILMAFNEDPAAASFAFGLEDYPEGYELPDDKLACGYFNGECVPNDYLTFTKYENGSANAVFRLQKSGQPAAASGDLNGDGDFSAADIVMLQKWLTSGFGEVLRQWENADFDADSRLTARDLSLMKAKLLYPETESYDFEAAYFRTDRKSFADDHLFDQNLPLVTVLNSAADLQDYLRAHAEDFYFSDEFLAEIEDTYTQKWFETHKLITVALEEGTGSARHDVTAVNERDIHIDRLMPQVGTTDMAAWHILIAVDKSADLAEKPNVVFTVKEVSGEPAP